jgi:hypothetical protein
MPLASGRQPDAFPQLCEPGIRCENIEPGVGIEVLHQQKGTSRVCALQPLERAVAIAESGVDQRDVGCSIFTR